jgi:hypothetical protein
MENIFLLGNYRNVGSSGTYSFPLWVVTEFVVYSIVFWFLQNIAVRKYLEKRAKEKEQDEKETKERDKFLEKPQPGKGIYVPPQQAKPAAEEASVAKGKTKRMWGRSRKAKDEKEEEEVNEADLYHSPRPAFFAHTRPTRRTAVPRDVAVPYFRFRKDRFYDWPPDPTVSRATPLLATSRDDAQDEFDLDGSRHPQSQYDGDGYDGEKSGGVRRRPGRASKNEEVDYGYG